MEKLMSTVLILFFTSLAVFSAGSGIAGEKQKTLRYTGIVQEVNQKEKTLFATRENRNVGLLFDAAAAKFTNIRGLQDLKPGDKVAVEYDARQAQTFAVSITRE